MASTFVSEQALARTYDPESGWETVTEYREATRLREDHPEMARAEIARRVGRSQSAVRGWLAEGKVPAVVKGLRTAREHGWLDVDSESERFRSLNLLVAWVYSGGGLQTDRFVPYFSVDDPLTLSTLTHLFRWLDISYRCREPEDPDHHREVVPRDGASVLGRVLFVLGAPVGVKADLDDLTLPSYLSTVDEVHRRDFARIYLLNRGGPYEEDVAGTSVYTPASTTCKELATIVESTTTGSATVSRQNHVWVSADAVRDLAAGTPIRSALATWGLHGSLSPPTERAFASTYRMGQTPGGYRYTQLYQQVQESEQSRREVANRFSLPASTVQSWRRGSKPYVLNGLERALERGWVAPDSESETALGLTALLAWVLARGSLRETFLPVFGSQSENHRAHFETIATAIGFSWSAYHVESSTYDTEFRPSEDGSVLGRVLYALGAARSGDTFREPLIPPYVFHYPAHARRFVDVWCLHHTVDREPLTLTVPTRLGEQFPDALEALLTDSLSWTVNRESSHTIVIEDADIASPDSTGGT